MNRTGEFATFIGLAGLLHVGIWLGVARPGVEAAGAGGDATVSLVAATGDIANLIETWTRPVDAQHIVQAALVAPDLVAPETPFRMDSSISEPERVAMSPPDAPASFAFPIMPNALPKVDLETVRPLVMQAAPRISLRPLARPAQPAAVAKPVDPKPETAARDPEPQPQSSAPQAQTAAEGQNGTHAGSTTTEQPAALSEAAKQNLLAKWGASIRNRIEHRKRYPRGTDASGTTVLRITLSRGGGLTAVSVASSSGTSALDQAAVQAVRRARYPAAPKGLEAAQYHFNLPLAFAKR